MNSRFSSLNSIHQLGRLRPAGGPWIAVGAVVVVSSLVRIVLARRVVAPWIFVDELIYSELAKSFAASGSFAIRGVPSHGYGFVYPAVIAPAWRAFAQPPE